MENGTTIFAKAVKLFRLARRPGYWAALQAGTAASTEHEALIMLLQPETVIDVGANRGQFTALCLGCLPEVRVIAFEPLADAAERFTKAIQSPQVVLHGVAIAPVAGTATMHRSRRDDSSSLLPIGAQQVQTFPGTEEVAVEDVRVARLGDFVTAKDLVAPSLLKIDVQGYELEVLRGSEDLLAGIDFILCETSFLELYEGQPLAPVVISWLFERSFVLDGIYNGTYDCHGRSIQADLLFRRLPVRTESA